MTIILKHQNLATEFINYDAITKKHILPKNRKLRINNAEGPTIIALTADITLTSSSLTIPSGKDITLTSVNRGTGFWRLTGAANQATIIVNGKLTLDGIVVTHANGRNGRGMTVNFGGSLIINSGEVSGNSFIGEGGGVYSEGSFMMLGGVITNNSAVYGGGVYNLFSTFSMVGGVISNNTVEETGGGVYNFLGSFSMSGSANIVNNTANEGGGVFNSMGLFSMSEGAVIVNNTATDGGGVYVSSFGASFSMLGGVIANNTAIVDNNSGVSGFGGGVYMSWGSFVMSDGFITNNTATYGGGVSVSFSSFTMSDEAVVANNTAMDGGGVYIVSPDSPFYMKGGVIANNTAIRNGGGIGVSSSSRLDYVNVFDDAVFSNNRASVAYNRAPIDDSLYNSHIGSKVTWTSPFTQGYNNYDITYTYGESLLFYAVTVSGSFAASSGAGSYLPDTSVTINAGSRVDYAFSGWTVNEGSVSLSSTTSLVATFTMPARNVVIAANWTPTTSGNGGSSSGGRSTSKPSSTIIPSESTPNDSEPSTSFPSPTFNAEWKNPLFLRITLLIVSTLLIAMLVVIGVGIVLLHRRPKGVAGKFSAIEIADTQTVQTKLYN